MLVDAHCHLEEIRDYIPKGVLPVTCGYSHSSNLKNIKIARRLGIPFVLGISPHPVIKLEWGALERELSVWTETIRDAKPRPNAIGEIGLDFHWAKNENDINKERMVFEKMINLAEDMRLPVVIHSRKAEKECLDYLRERKFQNGIMMHFFSGGEETAKKALDMGALLSFTPLHSKERRKVINSTPLENILIETDAPYVVRTPEEVIKAAEYVAEVKSIGIDEVVEKTGKNALKFFGWK